MRKDCMQVYGVFCVKTTNPADKRPFNTRIIRALAQLYPGIIFEITIPRSIYGGCGSLFAFVNILKKDLLSSMVIKNALVEAEELQFIVHHNYKKSYTESSAKKKPSISPIGGHLKPKCLKYDDMCFLPISKTRESIKWRANSCSPIDKHYL